MAKKNAPVEAESAETGKFLVTKYDGAFGVVPSGTKLRDGEIKISSAVDKDTADNIVRRYNNK